MTFEQQLRVVSAVMADKTIPSRSACRLAELRRRLPPEADLARLNRAWRAMKIQQLYKGWQGPA